MKSRIVLDIQITGHCNMHCKFCCGAPKNLGGPNYDEFVVLVDKSVAAGVTTMVFTGGEPLLKPSIEEYLAYAKNSGLEVYLSTNGLLLTEDLYQKIVPFIDTIGMPLDGSSTKMNEMMTRKKELFKSTTKHLKYFYHHSPKHVVKIGTIITAINKNDIINIGAVLYNTPSSYIPDVWRLYEFSALGEGARHVEKFHLDPDEFHRIVADVKKAFPHQIISALSDIDSNDSYLFINPNQKLELLTKGEYDILSDMQTMSVEDLRTLLNTYILVTKKGDHNRSWLNKNTL